MAVFIVYGEIKTVAVINNSWSIYFKWISFVEPEWLFWKQKHVRLTKYLHYDIKI